jgi:hypothetical protein
MKNPFALSDSKRSYLVKVFELVLALATVFFACTFFTIIISSIQPLRWMLPKQYVLILGNLYLYVFPVLLFFGCPLGAYFWHRKEIAGSMSPDRSHAAIRGFIRWGLAFALIFISIVLFDFPLVSRWSRVVLDDMTTSTVSSNYMFEYLLVRSLGLRVFLSGSFMFWGLFLFFRRTTIMGLVMAMFTMLFLAIFWITVSSFSEFDGGYVLLGALFVLGGYLLMLHLGDLRNKLIGAGQLIPPVAGMRFRWAMLLLVVASAGLVYKQSIQEMYKNKQLVGKWKVKVLERNGSALPATAWMTDDYAWTTVYVDANDELRFCSNPYKFDHGPSFSSQYRLDAEKGQLSITSLRNVGGPIQFRVEGLGTNELKWRGKVGPDEVRMVLAREL